MRKRIVSNSLIFLLVVSGLFGIFGFISSEVNAETWEIETVDSFENVGESTSIALDSGNNPHISYYDRTNTALKYARFTEGAWEIMTVDSEDNVGQYTSIALDAFDNPHISYYDATNQDLKYAGWICESWTIETLDSFGELGGYSSIAVDENNHVHISYYNGTIDLVTRRDSLKYAHWDGSSWSLETIDSATDVGRFTSIALDSEDFPHISYIDCTDSTLKYTRWTGSNWDIQEICPVRRQNENINDYGSGTSLALDSNDYPHIVFVGGYNDDLKYARWDGESWLIKDVGPVRQVFLYVSLALDSQDLPHITYFTHYGYTINYARLNNEEWDIVYVDRTGGNGKFNSLALDENDYAHISYFDHNLDDIKYARLIPSEETLEQVEFEEENYYTDPIYIIPIQPLPPIQIEPVPIYTITISNYNSIYENFTIEPDPPTPVSWEPDPGVIYTISDVTPPSYYEFDIVTTTIEPSDYGQQRPELYPFKFDYEVGIQYQEETAEVSEPFQYDVEIELPLEENEPEIVYIYVPVENNEVEEPYEVEQLDILDTTSDSQKSGYSGNDLMWYIVFFASLSFTLFFFLVITLIVVYRDNQQKSKK